MVRVVAGASLAMVGMFSACGGTAGSVPSGSGDAAPAAAASSSGSPTGSSSSSSSSGGSSGTAMEAGADSGADFGGVDAGPNDPECPPTYEEAPGHCTIGLRCGYAQGRCSCLGYCGGAPPPPDVDFSHWSCKAFTDNGCPLDPPEPGSACNIPTTCNYGDCCVQKLTCKPATGWSAGPMQCPP